MSSPLSKDRGLLFYFACHCEEQSDANLITSKINPSLLEFIARLSKNTGFLLAGA
jgi:hypothetical protein